MPGNEHRIRQPMGDRRQAQDAVELPLREPWFVCLLVFHS
jgi:hypothetical protein